MDNEGTEDLHGIVLRTAFKNLLAGPQQLQVITKEGRRLCINQHLFLLFSPLLRSVLAQLPPEARISGEPLTIILPDTSASIVMRLEDLLTTGISKNKYGATNGQEVLRCAAELGIDIKRVQGEGVSPSNTKEVSVPRSGDSMNNTSKIPPEKGMVKENPIVEKIMRSLASVSNPVNNPEPIPVIKQEKPDEEAMETNTTPIVNEPADKVIPSLGIDNPKIEPAKVIETNQETSVKSTTVETGNPSVETPKEFQCQKCQKSFDNLMHLRSHYCLHFKMILKKKFSNLSPENKCMDCSRQPSFASSDRLLLHIGVHHRKIDDILKSKGITLPSTPETMTSKPTKVEVPSSPQKQPSNDSKEPPLVPPTPKVVAPTTPAVAPVTPKVAPPDESPILPPTPNNSTTGISSTLMSVSTPTSSSADTSIQEEKPDTNVNFDLKCEICNQQQKTLPLLEQHCCRHFMKELKEQYASLMEDGKCNICGNVFKQAHSLLLHIGCKHGKVNEVLKQKGYAALPCPVTNTSSAAMQKQLIKIKQERVYTDEESQQETPSTDLLNLTPPSASSSVEKTEDRDVPTTLDEILKKYKFTTGSTTSMTTGAI